ncbi:hypothetical protein ColKHC_11169 [Colletotrichum higginsianum]|nr:hypothetical protein ColKHC_11169 [Colletotrichum higginsianum]
MLTLLLDVARLALETGVQGLAVDKHVTGDDTHRGPLRKDVKKSRLSGTGDTHEGSEDVLLRGHRADLGLGPLLLGRHGHLFVGDAAVDAAVLEVGGHKAAAEDEDLGGAAGGGVELGGDEVDDHEEDKEGQEDAEVAPDVGVVVLVVGLDEGVAADGALAGDGADGGADPRVAGQGRVGGDDGGADELAAVELVGDEDLKGVEDGVDPAEPAEPVDHLGHADDEAGVDDEGEHQDAGQRHGLRDGLGDGGHGAEDGTHDKGGDVGDEEVEEELGGLAAEAGQEVEGQVEAGGGDEFDGDVGDDAGDGLRGRVVEGVRGVLLDDGPLVVQAGDLGDGGEGVHEDGLEEDGALGVEAGGGVLGAVKDGADDEGQDDVEDGGRGRGGDVVPDALVGALRREADLHGHADEVGRLGADVLGLPVVLDLAELGEGVAVVVDGVLLGVAVDVLAQGLELGRLAPVGLEVVRGARHLVLHAGAGAALDGVRDGGQEVARRLALGAFPAHALKVGLGGAGRAEVDLAALVQDDGLVEEVVDGLAGLMATALALPAKSEARRSDWTNLSAVAESRPRVLLSHAHMGEPASIISAMLTRFRSPPETPRTKSLPTLVLKVWLRPHTAMTTCAACLWCSSRLMPWILCDGVRTAAANSSVWPTVKWGKCLSTFWNNTQSQSVGRSALELARHGLEQCAASGAGATEDDEELAAVQEAVEAVEDPLGLLLAEAEVLADPQRRLEEVADGLLQLERRAGPGDGQVLATPAFFLRTMPSFCISRMKFCSHLERSKDLLEGSSAGSLDAAMSWPYDMCVESGRPLLATLWCRERDVAILWSSLLSSSSIKIVSRWVSLAELPMASASSSSSEESPFFPVLIGAKPVVVSWSNDGLCSPFMVTDDVVVDLVFVVP